MASLDSHFLPAPTLALLQGRSDPTCLFHQFWEVNLYGQLSKPFAKSLARLHVHAYHEDGAVGPEESRGPAPACSPAMLRGSNPPMPDVLLLACVLFSLPRAPNHSANSMCGERSPRVISGWIPPLYSWLINSGCRVRMSYWLQECPPQREVNITARAGSPFLWQWILIKSFTPFSCCWLQLSDFKADSPCANLIQPRAQHLSLFAKCAAVSICKDKGKLLCQQVGELR